MLSLQTKCEKHNRQEKAVINQDHVELHRSRSCGILSVVAKQTLCGWMLRLFVGCLTSQQHASVSQGRISSDDFTCCHTETEVVDQTFHLIQSQYTDTGPTSPSTDPITPGAW